MRLSMAVALLMGGVLVAGVSLLGAVPATAAGTTWYAYPSGTSTSTTSCPETGTPSSECSLTLALSDAAAGDTVALATTGDESNTATWYVGNFTVSTGTSVSPVTIEAASGVTDPILDGNGGSASDCPTTACNGPVLSIGSGVYATFEGITVQDADNSSATNGGGIYNNGTATLTDDTFSGDSATYGGGVFDDLGSTATLTDDTFSGDSATYGGGIYNDGTATLTDDTFSGDSATYGGGIYTDGTATISNSILDAAPCGGSISDGGYNVESDDSCDFGTNDVVNSSKIDLASSLAANGSSGPETLAITSDSTAYEEVPSANCTVGTDERGDPRPGVSGENCDAGAFEYQLPAPTDTITFNSEGGTAVSSMSGPDGSSITLPAAPTYPGYTFVGWFTAASGGTEAGGAGASYTLSSSTTLYAHWTANATDTITFNSEGGSAVGSMSGPDGSSITLPGAPTFPGYTFVGWFTAASGGTDVGGAGDSYTLS
ncbi:MAG: InlB B-repeat-containing protein, partial [Acidimicrobiales bacterium]